MTTRITLRSNIASLEAQRRLGSSTEALRESFTRLSTGLRINKASDDAAGLSIASSLETDRRVYAQAMRNVSDAESFFNVAEQTVETLQNILIRQKELAEQAANGTVSNKQRLAMNEEAKALTLEYNRILSSSEFNGKRVFEELQTEFVLQAGYGESGSIVLTYGSELLRDAGDGTFDAGTTYAAGNNPNSIVVADFNGDGIDDIAVANEGDDTIGVYLGIGDGTFQNQIITSTGDAPNSLQAADFNNDGILDLANNDFGASGLGNTVSVIFGNGDGTFGGRISILTGLGPIALSSGDVNNDGNIDITAGTAGANFISGLPEQTRVTTQTNGLNEITNVSFVAAPEREVTIINTIAADSSVAEVTAITTDAASVQEISTVTAIAADTSIQEENSITTDAASVQEISTITTIEADNSAQEISTITADAIARQEVTDITVESGAGMITGDYFTIDSPDGDFYVWYNIDGGGGDPSIGGRTGVEVAILSTDTDTVVAAATQAAIDARSEFSASVLGATVTVTNTTGGSVTDAADGTIGGAFNVSVTIQGTNSDIVNGSYFTIDSPDTGYYVWFDINNTGTDPSVGGRTGIEVDVNWGDSADTVASAIQAAIDAQGDFGASVSTDTVTVTNANGGTSSNITKGDIVGSTFAVTTIQNGLDSDLQSGDYFYISSPDTDYYVWYNVDGAGSDPGIGSRTGIEVAVNSSDNADTVASKVQAAIDAQGDFSASVLSNIVTVTNTNGGAATNISDQTVGGSFSVATIQEGVDSDIKNGDYFLFDTPSNSYYVWFDYNNTGSDPTVGGRTGVEVDINYGDTAADVASALRAALGALGDVTSGGTGSTVTTVNDTSGAVTDISNGTISGGTFTTTVTTQGRDSDIQSGDYFYLSSPTADYYVWFNVDGGGGDPSIGGRTGVEVAVNSSDNADTVAAAIQAAVDAQGDFSASVSTDTVTITNAVGGAATNISDQTVGGSFSVATTQEGVNSDIENGDYFTLDTPSNSYYIWFDYNNTGTDPSVAGRTGVKVDINYGDSATDVASALRAAIGALGDITSGGSGSTVTANNDSTGPVTDATSGTITGGTFGTSVTTQGVVSDLLSGDYFYLSSTTTDYYVWYNVDGAGGNPNIGGRTGIEVALTLSDNADAVASKTSAAINALGDFSAGSAGSTVTVTNTIGGVAANGSNQTVGGSFSVSTSNQGTNSIIEEGDYFLVDSPGTNYYVWFNYGAASDPSIGGRTGIEVSLNYDDSAATIASAVAAAMDPLGDFSVSSSGNSITITNADTGPEGVSAGTVTGLSFTVTQSGYDQVITTGQYFEINATTTDYYVWFNVDGGGGDPSIGGKTGIEVAISDGDTANSIAAAIETAVGAMADFNTSRSGSQLTITNAFNGSATDGVNVNVGGTFSVTKLQDGENTRVDVTNDTVTLPSHGFTNELAVTLSSGATLPGGLSTGQTYYLIVLDSNTIAFATSPANAASNTRINLTSFGDGVHTILPIAATQSGGFSFGDGDGNFGSPVAFTAGSQIGDFQTADLNKDGNLDLISTDLATEEINVLFGDGRGNFTNGGSYSVGTDPVRVRAVDFNNDGNLDIVTANEGASGISVLIGDGSGTFQQAVNYAGLGSGANDLAIGDFNSDGLYDVITSDYNAGAGTSGTVFLSSIDGTFTAQSTATGGNGIRAVGVGDFNGDGIDDVVFANSADNNISVHFGNSIETFEGFHINLTTQEDARKALDKIGAQQDRVIAELAQIGAIQSRLSTIGSHVGVLAFEYRAAADRILTADIAEESATMVAEQIRQQIVTKILTQINLNRGLILGLIGDD